VGASWAFAGATDTPAFQTYGEQMLTPQLWPGDGGLWDNLKPPHDAQVRHAVERADAQMEPLPPWSPDLRPIEQRWSKLTEFLRSVAARTTEAVSGARGEALQAVRRQDIVGWFRSWGLCVTAGLKSAAPEHSADRRRACRDRGVSQEGIPV
jgi:transposase